MLPLVSVTVVMTPANTRHVAAADKQHADRLEESFYLVCFKQHADRLEECFYLVCFKQQHAREWTQTLSKCIYTEVQSRVYPTDFVVAGDRQDMKYTCRL